MTDVDYRLDWGLIEREREKFDRAEHEKRALKLALRTALGEEPMAKNDEVTIQPDDAKVEAKAETKPKSPSKSDLQARVDELEAKIERARKAFPNNGHIQRVLRD